MMRDHDKEVSNQYRVSEHLANERTYLAWLRTSLSLVGLGFATNRFGYFIKQEETRHIGIAMVVVGILLVWVSALRYRRVQRAIEAGQNLPQFLLLWVMTGLALVFAVVSLVLAWTN